MPSTFKVVNKLADLKTLATRLETIVQDEEFPITPEEYEAEIEASAWALGYEGVEDIPNKAIPLVLLKSQVNLYYMLSGKHARHHRVRIEGDMEIHSQQTAENYLKLAYRMEIRLDKEMARLAENIENIEATRYRVSTIGNVPRSNGGRYE